MPVIKSNVHTHTTFCDGADTMQDMAEYALNNGFDTLGFSFHSYTPFDKSYCIRDYYGYVKELHRIKEMYKGRLAVLNGVELDLYGERPSVCDYVIGSVHYIHINGRYMSIDSSEGLFKDMINAVFGGDAMAAVKRYYEEVAELPSKVNPDIYGHFDLITRYNAGGKYFDEGGSEYMRYAAAAVEALPAGAIAEVNLGRVFRGEGDIYPSEELIELMNGRGIRFMLSSDAHCRQAIGYNFDGTLARLKSLGVKSVAAYSGDKIVDIEI